MNKFQWNQFGQLKSYEDLTNYLSGREYGHGEYCHYTSLKSIDSILDQKQFCLSPVTKFNDKMDTASFGDVAKQYFSLCFSTGVNENLSLWYMYAGIDGKGGRLRFTKAQIKNLIEKAEFYLCHRENKCAKPLEKLDGKPLFSDVIYYADHENNPEIVDLKYNTMTNHQMPKEDFETYQKNYIGFFKSLIWYYEKETRLLVKVKESILQKYQKWWNDGSLLVTMSIDDSILQKMKIGLAPEIENIESELNEQKYPHIAEFLYDHSQVHLSKYNGQVHMDLCRNCEKNTSKSETDHSLGKEENKI